MTPAAPVFRFGPCELDESRRSLTAHGRELKLQPLVFDLLCLLVRHRERVVTKDELLEALWPRAVVVDNALQRLVSLARQALGEAGMAEAIRTYPRHGYRFCIDDADAPPAAPAAPPPGPPATASAGVAAAHAASERSDWPGACEAFAQAHARQPLGAFDILAWGRAAICAGQGPAVVPVLERLAGSAAAAGDALDAARASLLLVQIQMDQRQGVLARGLLKRAARFLDGQPESIEHGHLAWMEARMALTSGDVDQSFVHAAEACRIGRACQDADVECLGLTYLGHAMLSRGDAAGGLAQLEEAAAMIRLGGVCPWAAGWSLCSLL